MEFWWMELLRICTLNYRESDFEVRFFVFLWSAVLSIKNNQKYININLVENWACTYFFFFYNQKKDFILRWSDGEKEQAKNSAS